MTTEDRKCYSNLAILNKVTGFFINNGSSQNEQRPDLFRYAGIDLAFSQFNTYHFIS